MISLLSVDRDSGISSFNKTPNKPPNTKDPIVLANGKITSVPTLKPPLWFWALANEIAILYNTKQTISSRATTWSNVSTKSPFALVCFIVIIVDAGAVALARAARRIENVNESFKIKKLKTKINSEAINASNIVITITFAPFFFNTSSLKNSPVEKAMKARAISDRNDVPSMTVSGIKFKTNGPIIIPASI